MHTRVSAGVVTCNEERTIGPLLQFLCNAQGDRWEISQIIVVSAECRDGTDDIVRRQAAQDSRVKLITEPKRRGKSAAVNTFLAARSASELSLLTSGDVLPASDFLQKIVPVFDRTAVGMAGGRPVPVNDSDTLLGAMASLMWELHHEMALRSPKLGETVVFRSAVVNKIPEESPVDEASIEALILRQGLQLAYEAGAIVHNRGPSTVREWLSQRRRIAYGHAWLKQHFAHGISTGANSAVAGLLARHVFRHPSSFFTALTLIGCEAAARLLAARDLRTRKQYQIWDIAPSTKTGLSK